MDGSLPPTAAPATLQSFALLNKWRTWLLHSWFDSLKFGDISVTLPSGHQVEFNGEKEGPKANLKIDNLRLVNKLIASGDLGLAESYIAGEWSTSNLAGLLRLGLKNWEVLEGAVEKSTVLYLQVVCILSYKVREGAMSRIKEWVNISVLAA